MGRIREFNPDQALQDAMELFWEKGYEQTSMEDLVRKTGVSRYGFYNTFGDKRSLFAAAFNLYRDQVVRAMFGALEKPDAAMPEVQAVFKILRMKVAEGDTRGCLIAKTTTEMAPEDAQFRCLTQGVYDHVGALFERAFTNAVRAGQLPPGFKTKEVANLIAGSTFLIPSMVHAGFGMDRIFGYMSGIEAMLTPS